MLSFLNQNIIYDVGTLKDCSFVHRTYVKTDGYENINNLPLNFFLSKPMCLGLFVGLT